MAKIEDVPGLPRVLLIGDSISIGYTPSVRDLLKGKANVHRIPANGGPTISGLKNLKSWLGDTKWDVIHFNWGLHDLKYVKAGTRELIQNTTEPGSHHQALLADYEKNLVEVADEKTLRALRPNLSAPATLTVRGVIVTCRSEAPERDFVSRFFAPAAGVNEDPFTGSAHCALGPYWQAKLGKSDFTAFQTLEVLAARFSSGWKKGARVDVMKTNGGANTVITKQIRKTGVAVVAGMLLSGTSWAGSIEVKNGDKIAFLGDSITQGGMGQPNGGCRIHRFNRSTDTEFRSHGAWWSA